MSRFKPNGAESILIFNPKNLNLNRLYFESVIQPTSPNVFLSLMSLISFIKAASLDSINAVERELDEVLKDLELNSQDLSEQLNENVYNSAASVELPVNMQRGGPKKWTANKTQSDLGNETYEQSVKNLKYHMKASNAEQRWVIW